MKKPLTILQLTDIISHIEHMSEPDGIYPLGLVIENFQEFAKRLDTEPPAEGFHRDLWLAVRAETNRLLSDYAK